MAYFSKAGSTIWRTVIAVMTVSSVGLRNLLSYNVDASHSTFNDVAGDQHTYYQTVSDNNDARAPSDASAIGIYASGSSSLKLDGNTFTITSSKGSARGMILEDQSKAEGKNNKFFVTGDGGPA